MTYLRYVNELDIFDITNEPTEYIHESIKNETYNDVVIIVCSIVIFCLFFSIYCCCKMKKERNFF